MKNKSVSKPWLVVLLSGTAFFYFLIFAQFGYLHLLMGIRTDWRLVEMAMLAMGAGGISGCILTARRFRIERARRWVLGGYTGSGLAAIAALLVNISWFQVIVAMSIGLFLGSLTVAIVPVIRVISPSRRIGLWVSVGVGAAYFFCNIPVVFNSNADFHSLFGIVATIVGIVGSYFIPRNLRTEQLKGETWIHLPLALFKTKGVLMIAVLFLLLIWMDSSAFYLIQESEVIRDRSWGANWQLWVNAFVHFLAAILGGQLLDRGWMFSTLVGAFFCLLVGYILMGNGNALPESGALIYISGVSIYSTALVAYGALAPENNNTWRISNRAGLVFALGGWFGSAMGVGMASDLGRIPEEFLIIAAIVLAGCGWIQLRIQGTGKEEHS